MTRSENWKKTKPVILQKMWKKMAELGWLDLIFPADYGGESGEFMDLVLIEEALGAAVCRSPFFSTVVQCGLILMESGSEGQKQELLPRIAGGKLIMSLAQYESDGSYEVNDAESSAAKTDGSFVLNGAKMFVMDTNIAESTCLG